MSFGTAPLNGLHGNIAALLWRVASERPAAVAVIHGEQEITYSALRDRAASVALFLRARGVTPGDRVALLLERSADAAATIFGIQATGAIAVCINDRLRARQIEHTLRHSGARALITTKEMLARNARALDSDVLILDLPEISHNPVDRVAPIERAGGDLAQILYTSGSTGLPKGVCFSHRALITGVEIVSGYLGLRATDRVASLLGFSSVYGLNQLLCSVWCGSTLVIETSPLPHRIVSVIRERDVTVLAAVPPLWTQLLSVPSFREQVNSLRVLQNAGGHLPATVTRQIRNVQPHAQLFLQYGMTETFRSTFLSPDEVDKRPDCMGRAMPGTEILVLREDLTPCDVGETGELVHRGPTIAAGYWNDRASTELVFRPNPTRPAGDPRVERVVFSGDLVRRDADGFLYYVSRRDRVIKTLGFRVGPDEIVDVLFSSGEINECVVTTEPDAERGDRIVAFIVLAEGGSLERLKQFSRMELPRYMQPARIQALDGLPRLASGKYDLAALREPSAAT